MNIRKKLILLIIFLSTTTPPVAAGPGHDHGDAAPVATGNSPKRQADGSVFLPKPAQRQLGVRTVILKDGELPKALELSGRVVMDPNAGGKVQAIVAGRVTPGPRGLPLPGQKVSKGEVLAYVTPEVGGRTRSLAESRLQRLRELSDTVPRKMIEEAEAAVANEQLRAPVSGVIASASVVSGQVVDTRETLFEIVNPERMVIEALAFDMAVASNIASATLAVGDKRVPLKLVGVARSLREQALPLTFRGEGAAMAQLALGQPVKIVVQTRDKVRGIPLPTAALMKNPANQTIVWVKTGPERFEPRPVTLEPLDGSTVALLSGVDSGRRVAVEAANLINQIR